MIPLQKFYHLVLLDFVSVFEVKLRFIIPISSLFVLKAFRLELIQLFTHYIVLMKQLLLVPLKLSNLSLLAVIVSLELLHELLIRLYQGWILNKRRDLVALVTVCLVLSSKTISVSLINIVGQGRVELYCPLELLLEVGNCWKEWGVNIQILTYRASANSW